MSSHGRRPVESQTAKQLHAATIMAPEQRTTVFSGCMGQARALPAQRRTEAGDNSRPMTAPHCVRVVAPAPTVGHVVHERAVGYASGMASNRGFASMDAEKQREIASKGGKAAHAQGRAHEFSKEEAREAGGRGGLAVAKDREHMAAIGARGGKARAANKK